MLDDVGGLGSKSMADLELYDTLNALTVRRLNSFHFRVPAPARGPMLGRSSSFQADVETQSRVRLIAYPTEQHAPSPFISLFGFDTQVCKRCFLMVGIEGRAKCHVIFV